MGIDQPTFVPDFPVIDMKRLHTGHVCHSPPPPPPPLPELNDISFISLKNARHEVQTLTIALYLLGTCEWGGGGGGHGCQQPTAISRDILKGRVRRYCMCVFDWDKTFLTGTGQETNPRLGGGGGTPKRYSGCHHKDGR